MKTKTKEYYQNLNNVLGYITTKKELIPIEEIYIAIKSVDGKDLHDVSLLLQTMIEDGHVIPIETHDYPDDLPVGYYTTQTLYKITPSGEAFHHDVGYLKKWQKETNFWSKKDYNNTKWLIGIIITIILAIVGWIITH